MDSSVRRWAVRLGGGSLAPCGMVEEGLFRSRLESVSDKEIPFFSFRSTSPSYFFMEVPRTSGIPGGFSGETSRLLAGQTKGFSGAGCT